MNNNKQTSRVEGVVEESLPAATFRVKLQNGEVILAHLAGKMRLYRIKVVPGDHVIIETTPYDPKRGRIVRRT